MESQYITFGVEIDSIDPVLRVDGEISYWEFEGCEKLRLCKKNRYITIDVGMPRSRWEGINPVDIRKYLIYQLRNALELMLKRFKKEKYTVNDTELRAYFSKVEEEFFIKSNGRIVE
jgi:hypothetical protein